ncbi:MAG: ABC transporter ATP-binding protein [Bacteroidaceae bacterium]|nr:ABC transporter ATP-binding protein [Bacteroidaceae bacterium]
MNYKLTSLSIGYGNIVIAKNINATLEAGKMTCLLGPNGAGKSTLLRTLSAFQPCLGGEMHIGDESLKALTPQQLSKLIGVVLTERVSVQGMTVRDMIAMGRSPYTNFWGKLQDEDNRIVDNAIQLCGIQNLEARQISTLSDGERQKVMIAKALAQQTPIIMLDEPTAFLDFPSKVDTMLLLSRLAHEQQKAILISTHDLDLALQTADMLWLMGNHKGESTHESKSVLRVGTPEQLASDGTLPSFFRSSNIVFDEQELRFKVAK